MSANMFGMNSNLVYPESVGGNRSSDGPNPRGKETLIEFIQRKTTLKRLPVTPERQTIYIIAPPVLTADLINKLVTLGVDGYPDVFDNVKFINLNLNFTFSHISSVYEVVLNLTRGHPSFAMPLGKVRLSEKFNSSGKGRFKISTEDILAALEADLPGDAYTSVLLVDESTFTSNGGEFADGVTFKGRRFSVVSITDHLPTHPPNMYDCYPTIRFFPFPQIRDLPDLHSFSISTSSSSTNTTHSPILAAGAAILPFLFSPLHGTAPPTLAHASPHLTGIPVCDRSVAHLWLSSLCSTVAHEATHAFGLAHCTRLGCVMEAGDAGLASEAATGAVNPTVPYLCPYCVEKLMFAMHAEGKITAGANGEVVVLPVEAGLGVVSVARYGRLLGFCQSKAGNPMFAGLGAWIHGVLRRYNPKFVQAVLKGIGMDWQEPENVAINDHSEKISYSLS